MPKINEYPQAATINNNDLFVIDQESGGDHATKSASVSQIADKATSGVQSQIGDLSTLTTTDKSSLVGAVNEVNSGLGNKVDGTTPLLKYKTCSNISVSIGANASVIIRGSDVNLSISGYTPIAMVHYYSNSTIAFTTLDYRQTSGNGIFAVAYNIGSSAVNAVMNFTVLFVRNDIVQQG